MELEQIYKQEESVKISKGMTGKLGYEFKLLGNPKDNLERIKILRDELNKLTEVE